MTVAQVMQLIVTIVGWLPALVAAYHAAGAKTAARTAAGQVRELSRAGGSQSPGSPR